VKLDVVGGFLSRGSSRSLGQLISLYCSLLFTKFRARGLFCWTRFRAQRRANLSLRNPRATSRRDFARTLSVPKNMDSLRRALRRSLEVMPFLLKRTPQLTCPKRNLRLYARSTPLRLPFFPTYPKPRQGLLLLHAKTKQHSVLQGVGPLIWQTFGPMLESAPTMGVALQAKLALYGTCSAQSPQTNSKASRRMRFH